MYLIIKVSVSAGCLIIGLVILVILRKKQSNGEVGRFRRIFLWCSLIFVLGACYGVGILLSENFMQIFLFQKILLVTCAIIHVLGTLVNNELSYITQFSFDDENKQSAIPPEPSLPVA
jgi:Mn2+/Fe2+ NRAMP family transporter